jgi:hypothetical protein
MGWKRYAGHRPDANAAVLIRALRDAGVLCWPIGRPSDLLCRYADRLYLLDVDGVSRNRKRDQTQLDNFALWDVVLVKTPEQALRAIGAIK